MIDAQIREFHAVHPDIRIEFVHIPEGVYTHHVELAALSGDLPDILGFDGPYLAYYTWLGMLRSLDKFLTEDMKADFLPSILEQGTYNGHIYGLGVFDSGLGIWGNKRYLERAGVRIPKGIHDPWSGAEFAEALKRLQDLPEVTYALDLKMNYGRSEWLTYGFLPLVQSYGGGIIDRTTYRRVDGILNGPETVRALQEFQRWFREGYANPRQSSDTDFIEGKSALSWVGHWMWPEYHQTLGDDLLLLPMPKFGERAVTGMGSWGWGITSYCMHPDAAWQFLAYILSPEQVLRASNKAGAIPSRKSAIPESPLYRPGGPLHLHLQQLQHIAVARPVTPAYPTVTRAFADALMHIQHGADVKTELDKAVRRIEEAIQSILGEP